MLGRLLSIPSLTQRLQEPFQSHLNFPGRARERNEPRESHLSHGNPDPIFHVPSRARLEFNDIWHRRRRIDPE